MLELDHLVVNTRFDTDAAQEVFARLGFTLTPRGYHTLGSINHAIMFADHYLELIGLPADRKTIREEIAASPLGADGLVFRTADPAATFDALQRAGLQASPPQTFSRPVPPLGDARFATVRLAAGQLPGGRVYFCQHLTPELVFRDEWQAHPNGAYALERLHLIDADEAGYARLGPLARGFELAFWSRESFDRNFGALAVHVSERAPRFAAITLRTPQWREIAERASAAALPVVTEPARTLVALPRFDTLLEFIE
jgi:hypothetical protein